MGISKSTTDIISSLYYRDNFVVAHKHDFIRGYVSSSSNKDLLIKFDGDTMDDTLDFRELEELLGSVEECINKIKISNPVSTQVLEQALKNKGVIQVKIDFFKYLQNSFSKSS